MIPRLKILARLFSGLFPLLGTSLLLSCNDLVIMSADVLKEDEISPIQPTSLTSTSDDAFLLAGDELEIHINYSGTVFVRENVGLSLLLGDEESDTFAAYSGGSGSDTLSFTYKVRAGDNFKKLESFELISPKKKNPISDTQGKNVSLDLKAPSIEQNITLAVDTLAPSLPGSPLLNDAQGNDLDIAFSWAESQDENLLGYHAKLCEASNCSEECGSTVLVGNTLSAQIPGMNGREYFACVQAEDMAGNRSDWSASSSSVLIKNDQPDLSINSPTLLSLVTQQNAASFPIQGSCSENDHDIELRIKGNASSQVYAMSVPCSAAAWSAAAYLRGLSGTEISIRAEHKNIHGLSVVRELSLVSYLDDSLAPSLSFTSITDPFVFQGSSAHFAFTASDDSGSGLASLSWAFSLDGTNFAAENPLALADRQFDLSVPTVNSLVPNAKVRLYARDLAGNLKTLDSESFQIPSRLDNISLGSFSHAGSSTGTAAQTRFRSLNSMTTDDSYLYVSDGDRILRISLADGSSILIAGNLKKGAEDGTAANAFFWIPAGLAVIGNYLYASDNGNHTIRRINIDPSSTDFRKVTTVAGLAGTFGSTNGIGSAARFRNPTGLATDGTYLYITDRGNHFIRRMDPDTGNVETLAGAAGVCGDVLNANPLTARFCHPTVIAYRADSLYVTENVSRKVKKIDLSTLAVTSFAFTGGLGLVHGAAASASAMSPFCSSSDSSFLYCSDISGHIVRKVAFSDRAVSLLAGKELHQGYVDAIGTAARFSAPGSSAFTNGYLYVADGLSLIHI